MVFTELGICTLIKSNILQTRHKSRDQLFDNNRVLDTDDEVNDKKTKKDNLRSKLNKFFESRQSIEYFINYCSKHNNKMLDEGSNKNGGYDSDDGGDGRRNEDKSAGELASGICKLLEKLTSSQISTVEDRIINYCCKYIVPFKVNNVRKFLGSVQSCCVRFLAGNQVTIVLDYARTRVTADPIITTKTYHVFADFKADVLSRFKPQKDVLQANQAIALMHQRFDEDISKYVTRVLELKDQYEEAVFAKYAEDNVDLSARRLEESEDLCVRYFILGLKPQIRSFMQGIPKSLRQTINEAETVESNLDVQQLRKNMSKSKDEKNLSNGKNGNYSNKNNNYDRNVRKSFNRVGVCKRNSLRIVELRIS